MNRGGMVSVAGSNKEYRWQQMMQTEVGLNEDDTTICDTAVAHSQGLQNQERLNDRYCSLSFSPNLATLDEAVNLGHTQDKSHFIDAWCTAERVNIGHEINKCSSSNLKLQRSFHTLLPVYGEDESRNAVKNVPLAFGTLGSEQENEGYLKSQWMSSFSWMRTSPPGGPLAEALCVGNTSSAKAASSPLGCSSGTTSSSSRS